MSLILIKMNILSNYLIIITNIELKKNYIYIQYSTKFVLLLLLLLLNLL